MLASGWTSSASKQRCGCSETYEDYFRRLHIYFGDYNPNTGDYRWWWHCNSWKLKFETITDIGGWRTMLWISKRSLRYCSYYKKHCRPQKNVEILDNVAGVPAYGGPIGCWTLYRLSRAVRSIGIHIVQLAITILNPAILREMARNSQRWYRPDW